MPHSLLIAGYYGFGNTGDETILAAMIADLKSLDSDIRITVISGNPSETEKSHVVNSVPWADIHQITLAAQASDMIILGGGGIFHDYWGFDQSTVLTSRHIGISFYTSIAMIAALLKKPLMLYSVGVGPLLTNEGKTYVRAIAEQASIITVRDHESKDLLIDLHIAPERITVTADPAFRLQRSVEIDSVSNHLPTKEIRLGVALRNWDVGILPDEWESNVAAALDIFLDNHPLAKVLFIPFQDSQEQLLDDHSISRRVQGMLRNANRTQVVNGSSTFSDCVSNLAGCNLVLGMRLHSLILAIGNGIPVVGLIYDPKVRNLMSQAGIGQFAIDLNNATPESISGALEEIIQRDDALSTHLRSISSELAMNALINARQALDFLEHGTGIFPAQQDEGVQSLYQKVILSLSESLETQSKQRSRFLKKSQEHGVSIQGRDLSYDEFVAHVVNVEKELENHKRNLENLSTEKHEVEKHNTDLLIQVGKLGDEKTMLSKSNRQKEDQIYQLHKDLIEADNQRKALERSSRKKDLLIRDLKTMREREHTESSQKIEALEIQSGENIKQNSLLSGELRSIKSSRGWKLLWGMWQIRLFILPHGSFGERIISKTWKNIHNLFQSPGNYGKVKASKILNYAGIRRSNQALAFHLYKRDRSKIFPSDLRNLDISYIPGLVSIVLPVFNGGKFLRESLDSVLNQTYAHFELIIVDDGSTDDSRDIAQEYAARDERIRVVCQQNQKLPMALNNGFAEAYGEFLTWTSHDNICKPEYLEKMVSCLNRHASWDMIYANMDIIGDDGLPLRNSDWFAGYQVPFGSEHIHLPSNIEELNTEPNNFIGGAFLYRQRVKKLLTGYSAYQFTREDYDQWMQVNSLFTLKHADFSTPVYDYRFHPQSLTSQDNELKITRDRKFLMVFDDFRRDFYLMPLIWILDGRDDMPALREAKQSIGVILKNAGQMILTAEEYQKLLLPRLWLPVVYLKITDGEDMDCPASVVEYNDLTKAVLFIKIQNTTKGLDAQWDVRMNLLRGKFDQSQIDKKPMEMSSRDVGTLLHGLDIFVRSRHLKLIETEINRNNKDRLKISVIICTYRRNEILEGSLRAIARQTLPQSAYEVIVVDNHPEGSGVSGLIEHLRSEVFQDHPEHLRSVQCPILGLSFARNAGISEAKSDLLLFLDDDAIAENDILEQYLQVYSAHANAGIIGGHIEVKRPDAISMVWKDGWERYWSQFITGYKGYTEVDHWWEYPWGANWSARRKVLLQIGGFRCRYGRRGNDFNGGEEIVAASLVHQLGYKVGILPSASVSHHVDPSRFNSEHLENTIRSSMFVQYIAQQNLHLPNETSIGSSFRQVIQAISKCLSIFIHPHDIDTKANLFEISYQLSARWRLLLRQISDGFHRVRWLGF